VVIVARLALLEVLRDGGARHVSRLGKFGRAAVGIAAVSTFLRSPIVGHHTRKGDRLRGSVALDVAICVWVARSVGLTWWDCVGVI
jgi:hypothetical protein